MDILEAGQSRQLLPDVSPCPALLELKCLLIAGLAAIIFAAPAAYSADRAGAVTPEAGNPVYRNAVADARTPRQKSRAALALHEGRNPESSAAVQNPAARPARIHAMRALIGDGSSNRSNGSQADTQARSMDGPPDSSPFEDDHWFFASTYGMQTAPPGGAEPDNSTGADLEFRSSLVTASGELYRGPNDDSTGASVSLDFALDDHWTFHGRADPSGTATPPQARRAGIHARHRAGELVWQAHESRSAALSYGKMDFNDGNRRDFTRVRWTERLISGSFYKLDVAGALYASRNSLSGASYFNPSRDFSPTLEFTSEWLQWQRHARSFRHRVVVAIGSYWQQGFGTGPVAGAHYEQEWDADDRLTIRYGVGRSVHPYDGVQAAHNYGYFALNWRF